jgi:uncharacterized protein (DUF433 family)
MAWVIEAKRGGKRVIAVRRDRIPDQFEEPVLTGIEEQLLTDPTWLVERPHRWRRQAWIKGRRMTAGDLARTIEIEAWSPERAASEFDLPLDAILEAQRYFAANRELVLAEEQENALAAQEASAVRA